MMALVLRTAGGYLLCQVKQEFIARNSAVHEGYEVMSEGGFVAF
jgi:hypothetical protein